MIPLECVLQDTKTDSRLSLVSESVIFNVQHCESAGSTGPSAEKEPRKRHLNELFSARVEQDVTWRPEALRSETIIFWASCTHMHALTKMIVSSARAQTRVHAGNENPTQTRGNDFMQMLPFDARKKL